MVSRKSSSGKAVSAEESNLFRQTIDENFNELDSNFIKDEIFRESTTDDNPSNPCTTDKGIIRDDGNLFYRSGVRKQTLKNLKSGRLIICDEIDLHGYTKKEAIRHLQSFIYKVTTTKSGCVRVVTGKGKSSPNNYSVVREATLAQLRNEPRVLAYSIAMPKHGGAGALYVLLNS